MSKNLFNYIMSGIRMSSVAVTAENCENGEPQAPEESHQGQANIPEIVEPEDDDAEEQEMLKYGAKHVMMLIVPVSLCMIIVIFAIRIITMYDQVSQPQVYLVYTPFNDQTKKTTGKPY